MNSNSAKNNKGIRMLFLYSFSFFFLVLSNMETLKAVTNIRCLKRNTIKYIITNTIYLNLSFFYGFPYTWMCTCLIYAFLYEENTFFSRVAEPDPHLTLTKSWKTHDPRKECRSGSEPPPPHKNTNFLVIFSRKNYNIREKKFIFMFWKQGL